MSGGPPRARLCAAGDLMLAGEWHDGRALAPGRGAVLRALSAFAGNRDVFVANLETALVGSAGTIAKEPVVIAPPAAVTEALEVLGADVVCLANNHAFDGRREGFEAMRSRLDAAGMVRFGAGLDASEAARPVVVEDGGLRLGWLGYVARDTRPSDLAGQDRPGVNALDEERALGETRALAREVDHVIVSLHWGVEYCHLAAPSQVRFARALVGAGARVVLGHHAHVVQGVERWREGLIAYGLGNLTTTDFFVGGRRAIRQTRRTRSSFLLRIELDRRGVTGYDCLPFRWGADGTFLRGDAYASALLARANERLARGVSEAGWRRRRLLEDVVLRTLRKLHPRVIGSVRPRHAAVLLRNAVRASAGRGPA